jgi:hypothetical protein
MLLADEFGNRRWPHAFGEGAGSFLPFSRRRREKVHSDKLAQNSVHGHSPEKCLSFNAPGWYL